MSVARLGAVDADGLSTFTSSFGAEAGNADNGSFPSSPTSGLPTMIASFHSEMSNGCRG